VAVKPEQQLENWAQYGRALAMMQPYTADLMDLIPEDLDADDDTAGGHKT
jgi:hypothetical protein